MGRVLLAIDGNSLVHRSFHSQARTGLHSTDGRPMWAVRGLLSQLVAAVDRSGADTVVVGFDDPETSLRRDTWPQYKAHRSEKLAALVDQLAFAADVLRGLGVAVIVPPSLEADDVLASAARTAADADAETVIMTSDRDAFALIDERTSVLRIIDGGVEASPLITPARLVSLLGVRPDQYRDYAALRGDASDNLPGVRGIGAKTAARLLAAFGSARAAFDDLACGGDGVVAAVGAAGARRLGAPGAREAWELNCQVMALHADLPLDIGFSGGAGCLPLAADAVRATYLAQQLTWTTSAALRVLAGQEGTIAEPAPDASWADEPEWFDEVAWSAPRRRFSRLPARPKVEQPTLF